MLRLRRAPVRDSTHGSVGRAAPGGVKGPGQGGKGIGRQVSALAKSGVHGPQLAAQVHRLQAANGIGQGNGNGKEFKPAKPAKAAKAGKKK